MRPGPRTRYAVRRRAPPRVADRRRRRGAAGHRHHGHGRPGHPSAGDRRAGRRCRVARGPCHHPVPRVPAGPERRSPLCHRGEGRLRRSEPLRLHPRVRPPSRQHSQTARAARRAGGHGSAEGHDRLLPRPALGLRVRRESGRREARLRDLQRYAGGRRVGRGVGGRDDRGLPRVDRRVPDSALAAALCAARDQYVRVRDLARHPALQRAGQLAAVPQLADGDFLTTGRADRLGRPVLAAAARGRPVCRHQERVCADWRRL